MFFKLQIICNIGLNVDSACILVDAFGPRQLYIPVTADSFSVQHATSLF